MSRTKWILVVAAALLIVIPLAAVLWLQSSIRGLIENQGREAFGVPTTVASADLGLFSGRLDLSGVRIANPEGFQSSGFVDADRIQVDFEPSSLMSETVRISRIEVENVEVNLENQSGKFNYRPILDHLNRATQPVQAGDSGQSGRKLLIAKLHITGIQGRVELGLGGAALGSTRIQIPDQTFENLGSDQDGSMALRQLMGRIVESLMRGVAVQGKGELNRELLGDLWGRLAGEAPADKPAKKPPIEDVVKDLQDLLRKP